MINLEKIFLQLDDVNKFFQFRRKEIIKSIKTSLIDFSNKCNDISNKYINLQKETGELKNTLNNKVEALSSMTNQYNNLQKEAEKARKILDNKTKELSFVNQKYNLVSSFLSATPIKNESMEKFKNLLYNDFIEFANSESALAEEAKALLLLQDVEKRLQDIITFPSIYNKNIVAVGGGFSAGKSEFLNSLFIDSSIKLPVGINPVTAIPTYITVGDKNSIKGYSYKGGIVELLPEIYKELSHDFIKSLGFNLKDIAPIMAIETPMKSYQNICFIDTPGYNPSNTGYTDNDEETSQEYLKHANTLLWIIGIDTNGTIPASDLDFLENISLEDKKLYIIANKADLRSSDDVEDILDIFEEILDEYDIEYEGISAFSSINKEELNHRKVSLFNFLEEVNNPVEVQKSILLDLKNVFKMYRVAIDEQISWTKNIQSHLKSLDLDFLRSGIDIEDYDKPNEKINKIRALFNSKSLKKQLKDLEKLEEKMVLSAKEIFSSLGYKIIEINSEVDEEHKVELEKSIKIKEQVSSIIEKKYYDSVKSLETYMKHQLMDNIESYFKDAKNNLKEIEGSETNIYGYGFFGLLFESDKYETTNKKIKNILEELTHVIEDSINIKSISYLQNWEKKLNQTLLKVLRNNVDDEDLDLEQFKKAIKNLHNSIIKYPDIKYSDSLPASLEISDNLTDIKDEKLIVEAKKFISSLESRVKYDVDIYLKELLYNLNNIKISQDIFNYDEILREP